jgi:hypothetical protein
MGVWAMDNCIIPKPASSKPRNFELKFIGIDRLIWKMLFPAQEYAFQPNSRESRSSAAISGIPAFHAEMPGIL